MCTTTWSRALLALAAGAAAALLAAPGLAADEEAPGGVSVQLSPTSISEDLDGREFAVEVRVTNRSTQRQRVRLSLTGLAHDLDGGPRFRDDPAVTEAVELETNEIELAPDERRGVAISGEIPADRAALYAAVLAEPALEEERGIRGRPRLATLLFLRGPGPWQQALAVDGAAAHVDAEGSVQLAVEVANRGDVHATPTGTLTVADGAATLATLSLSAAAVLPGQQRLLRTVWEPEGAPPDELALSVALEDPPAEARLSVPVEQGPPADPAPEGNDAARPRSSRLAVDAPGSGGPPRGAWIALAAVLLLATAGGLAAISRRPSR